MNPTPERLSDFKEKASNWAKKYTGDSKTVIIDLESTGLLTKDPDTEIVQFSAINTSGRQILSMLIKPVKPMSQDVVNIHKITNDMVEDAPVFPQVAKLISFLLENKTVIAYNADFDLKLLWHLFKRYEIPLPKVKEAFCCMDKYSEWVGEWSPKAERFKWQRLPNFSGGSAHDALVDCQNTLQCMKLMSGEFDPLKTNEEEIDLNFLK